MILPAWACQTASGLVEQVGIQLEQEFGEGGGLGLEFLDDGLGDTGKFLVPFTCHLVVVPGQALYPEISQTD